ncbi:MAG TPA: hypothetical protein VN516_09905, partial [Candidatus Baltobacteraceae bacterium]|nr:hypothetical protein [Candidatus Baltobacteraceae bacterium]
MNKFFLSLITVLVFIFRYEASSAIFYVAANGSDTNSGEEKSPFHSLEHARDEIRELKAHENPQTNSISVVVRGGTYLLKTNFTLDAQDSGATATPIIWTAAPNEVVRLCGGIIIPANAFHTVTNKMILSRLDAVARDHVFEANLHVLGISKLQKYPAQFRGAPLVLELFFNDQRQQVARWPNEGWATI